MRAAPAASAAPWNFTTDGTVLPAQGELRPEASSLQRGFAFGPGWFLLRCRPGPPPPWPPDIPDEPPEPGFPPPEEPAPEVGRLICAFAAFGHGRMQAVPNSPDREPVAFCCEPADRVSVPVRVVVEPRTFTLAPERSPLRIVVRLSLRTPVRVETPTPTA